MDMIIRRRRHRTFTSVSNEFLFNEKRLSAKAKYIYTMLVSMPDWWKFHISNITDAVTDGRDSVRAGLRELEDTGYIVRTQERDQGGRLSCWHIEVLDVEDVTFPNVSPETGFPATVKPSPVKPEAANPTVLNTDLINTEESNTKTPPTPHSGGGVEGENLNPEQPPSFPKPPTPNPPIPPPPPSRSRLTVAQMQRFEQWYRQYPKKVSRGQAEKAWLTVERMNDVDVDGMIEKLEEQKASPDWLKEGGKYIPHPATYLNAKKWLDEADAPESSDDLFDNYVAAGLKAQFG